MNKLFFTKNVIYCLLIYTFFLHTDNVILFEKAQYFNSQEQFKKALGLFNILCNDQPCNTLYQFHKATTLLSLGYIDEAINVYDRIFQLNPYFLQALYNKGYALKINGQLDKAIDVYNQVLCKDPHNYPAQIALGFAYLAQGNFVKGWAQHEKYLVRKNKNGDALRQLIKDDNCYNKKIVLAYEGGLGDTLQFIRYARRLKEKNAHVTVCVQKPLYNLLSNCPYIDILITDVSHVKECDAYCSLMSLPAIFNDNENTFPADVPYLFVDSAIMNVWNHSFDNRYYNIGICWQASVSNDVSRLPVARRGIPLEQFKFINNKKIRWCSLQKYDGVEQLQTLNNTFDIHVFDDTFDRIHGNFVDTAAIIQKLDLVITVDSAVAHLAGALGRPVWLLLPFSSDWRWMCNRKDSPWYPTMRIFRQGRPFDWDTVIKQVKRELEKVIV